MRSFYKTKYKQKRKTVLRDKGMPSSVGQTCPAVDERSPLDHAGESSVNAVKVIAFWTGWRRSGQPQGAEDSLVKLKYIIQQEKGLDYGAPMNLIIVNSLNTNGGDEECFSYLNSLNGTKTKNGTVTVLHKNNFGISFGAFSYAFDLYKNYYKYWFFCEDDYLTVKPNVMGSAIKLLDNTENLGFVATVEAVSRGYSRPYARGGSGITTRDVILKTHGEKINFHSGGNQGSYRYHQRQGERWFTFRITKGGYDMTTTPIAQSVMIWGCEECHQKSTKRNPSRYRTDYVSASKWDKEAIYSKLGKGTALSVSEKSNAL